MKKPILVLKGICTEKIDERYYFFTNEKTKNTPSIPLPPPPPLSSPPLPNSNNSEFRNVKVSLLELPNTTHTKTEFSFLDESKKEHHCVLTMKSMVDQKDLPDQTEIFCFWCRSGFSTRPIGCPITYVPDRITKKYHSDITKDHYTLRENITRKQTENMQSSLPPSVLYQKKNDYFITDGIFCSFNCTLAFIHESVKGNPMYSESESYLQCMYRVSNPDHDSKPLTPAPSWRLLASYGGTLSIEEYRKNFHHVHYLDTNNVIYPFPTMKPMGYLFEKQVKI